MSATRQRVETERTGALACALARHFERNRGNVHPSNRSPRGGKERDKEADESNESFLRRLVARVGGGTDGGDDEVADDHTGSADQEHSAPTSLVSEPETVKRKRLSRSAISLGDFSRNVLRAE